MYCHIINWFCRVERGYHCRHEVVCPVGKNVLRQFSSVEIKNLKSSTVDSVCLSSADNNLRAEIN